jgi:hypothetical protein
MDKIKERRLKKKKKKKKEKRVTPANSIPLTSLCHELQHES